MTTRGKTPGSGRRKGTPNKSTADVRAAFAELLQGAAPKLEKWLTRVARKEPGRALDIVTRLAEYHIPKLSKTVNTQIGEVRVVNLTGVKVGGGAQGEKPDEWSEGR
jgi:hypothetical protein